MAQLEIQIGILWNEINMIEDEEINKKEVFVSCELVYDFAFINHEMWMNMRNFC